MKPRTFDQAAPSCPHCGRELEDPAELAAGLCTSGDCPRHDAPDLAAAADQAPAELAELAELEAMRDELDKLVDARERRLATLDYPEHELAAIRFALAATRCAA